jgi:hypothetical protein
MSVAGARGLPGFDSVGAGVACLLSWEMSVPEKVRTTSGWARRPRLCGRSVGEEGGGL